MRHTVLLVALAACTGVSSKARPDCAKVLCGADEYCRYTTGGEESSDSADNLPLCTTAPTECHGEPTCDCIPDCSSCEDDDGLIRCTVETP